MTDQHSIVNGAEIRVTPRDVLSISSKFKMDEIYDAIGVNEGSFNIDFNGEKCYCLLNSCAFLGGGSWMILDEESDESTTLLTELQFQNEHLIRERNSWRDKYLELRNTTQK